MKYPRRVRTRYVKEILDDLLSTTIYTNKELMKKINISESTFYDIQAVSKEYTRTVNLNRIAHFLGKNVVFKGEKPVLIPKELRKDQFLTQEQFSALLETLDPSEETLEMLRSRAVGSPPDS